MKKGCIQRIFRLFLVFTLIFTSLNFILIPKDNKVFAGEIPLRDVLIGDFETDAEMWTFFNGPEFPGAKGSFSRYDEDSVSGTYSGKLIGDFTDGGNYVSMRRTFTPVDARELSFWVKTSDIHTIIIRVVDSTGQTHHQRIPLQETSDWQQISVTNFAGGIGYIHWGGADDGVWHGPAKEVSFLLDKNTIKTDEKTGTFLIDNVVMKEPMPPLEINQTKLGNIFQSDQGPVTFKILTQGDKVIWSIYDYWGTRVAGQTEVIEAGSKTIELPYLKTGYYTIKMVALRDGNYIGTAENTFAVLPPNDLSQVSDSPFGMSTHFGQAWDSEIIPLLEQAGAKNIRDELYWNRVEPEKGVYEFPESYTNYMNKLKKHRINPFIIYSYTNPNYDNNSTPYTDDGRRGFAEYGRQILKEFDNVKWVEVYNEFNISFGDRGDGPADSKPEYYFKLLKETYETVKAYDPDVIVVGAATAGVPYDWLEELFKLGGLDYMDAVSIHPYRYPGKPENLDTDIIKLQDLIKQYNDGQSIPIWITEMGWPTQKDARGVSEDVQAQYIVRSHIISLSVDVEKIFWYDFMNDGLDETYNEHNFGIIRNPGDQKGKYAPKPAYVAYAIMTRQLTGAKFSHREDIGDGIYSYVFNSNGTDIRVIWSDEIKQIKVKTEKPLKVIDLMGGEEILYPAQGGYVYLTISESPMYIKGNAREISEGSKFALKAKQVVSGDPIEVILIADNTEPPVGRITANININDTYKDFDVMPHEVKEVYINLPGEYAPQNKVLSGMVYVKGKPIAKLMTEVKVTDPIKLQVKHILKDNKDMLRVTISNLSLQEYEVEHIDWQIGEKAGTTDTSLIVEPNASESVDIPVPELPIDQNYSVKLTINAVDGEPIVYNTSLRLININDMNPAANFAIEVDGILDDLIDVSFIDFADGEVKISDYGGVEDLSGKVWLTWDEDYLYLSAKIHDDVFFQSAEADSIWQGDSIQFSVSQGLPGESKEWYEYGIALTQKGQQVYRWLTAEGQPVGLVDNAQLQITRDENAKETIYELALPWTELKPCEPIDGMISFSVLVNDNDGKGRKGWIEWGSGIGESKDNKLFRAIYLEK